MLAIDQSSLIQKLDSNISTENIPKILAATAQNTLEHKFIGDKSAAMMSGDGEEIAPVPNIAVIDSRSMLRDCVVQFVTSHHRLIAAGYANVDEMMEGRLKAKVSVVVLYSATHSRQQTLDDMAKLRDLGLVCPIVILVDTSDCGFIKELLHSGARGVIPTIFPANLVLEAIHLVLAGGTFAPVESFMAVQQYNAVRPNRAEGGLTAREAQIVELLRAGKPNKQIAFELDLSLGTVKVHLHNIMKKLGAHNRLQVLANRDASL